jgi:hypothetical protein
MRMQVTRMATFAARQASVISTVAIRAVWFVPNRLPNP